MVVTALLIAISAIGCRGGGEKNKGGVAHYSPAVPYPATNNYYPHQQQHHQQAMSSYPQQKYQEEYAAPQMIVPAMGVKAVLRAQRRQQTRPNSKRAQRDRYYSAIFNQMVRQAAKQLAKETINDLDIFSY